MGFPDFGDLIPVQVLKVHDQRLVRTEGLRFFWPESLLEELSAAGGEPFATIKHSDRVYELGLPKTGPLIKEDFFSRTKEQIVFTSRPTSAKLPFSYQFVPHKIRWLVASYVARSNKTKKEKNFPQWPLDLSLDSLSDILRCCSGQDKDIPDIKGSVLLTHDIDTPESFDNLHLFHELEEGLGVRSTNFVVPKAWKLDHSFLKEASAKGHEIRIHGYNHDNKTAFLPDKEILWRIEQTADMISTHGARGYRAPSLLRTKALFEVLKKYFDYDSSIPNSGVFHPSVNGCATVRPFYQNGLLEIPLTLPSDALLQFFGMKPSEILQLWKDLTGVIVKSGGVLNLLTHCEARYSGNKTMLGIYAEYIDYLKSLDLCKCRTVSEVADIFEGTT